MPCKIQGYMKIFQKFFFFGWGGGGERERKEKENNPCEGRNCSGGGTACVLKLYISRTIIQLPELTINSGSTDEALSGWGGCRGGSQYKWVPVRVLTAQTLVPMLTTTSSLLMPRFKPSPYRSTEREVESPGPGLPQGGQALCFRPDNS